MKDISLISLSQEFSPILRLLKTHDRGLDYSRVLKNLIVNFWHASSTRTCRVNLLLIMLGHKDLFEFC